MGRTSRNGSLTAIHQESRSATVWPRPSLWWRVGLTPSLERQERKRDNAREECHDRVRRLQRRGACRDEEARRRVARRGQEGRQEGRRSAGGPRQHRGDGTGGSCASRARACDGDRDRPRVVTEDLVRDARLRERGRQGRRLLPERGQVQLPLLDPGLPGRGEPRRRRHVAGVVRTYEVEPQGGGEGRRAGEGRDLLTGPQPPRRAASSSVWSLAPRPAAEVLCFWLSPPRDPRPITYGYIQAIIDTFC